jgi:methylmalonyl-CoA mutase
VRHLAEIAETIEEYDRWADEQSEIARGLYQLQGVIDMVEKPEKN